MNTIATDNPFSADDTATLSTLAGMMIPASDKYAVPGADDPTILADIIATARQHADVFEAGLKALDEYSRDKRNAAFSALDLDNRTAIVEVFQQTTPLFLRGITSITAQCYYRDARVMASLGMEPRPPYPIGFELSQGDWGLLDPVRDRGKIWRDAG